MKTKILNDVPGYEGNDIVIKKFDYGEKLDLQEDSIKVAFVNGKEEASISISKLKFNTIINGIVTAPFFTMADKAQRLTEVRSLEPETGDFLYLAIQEFNSKKIDEDVKKKLEPSQEETSSEKESVMTKPEDTLVKQ